LQNAAIQAASRVKIRQMAKMNKKLVVQQLSNALRRIQGETLLGRLRRWKDKAGANKHHNLLAAVQTRLQDASRGTAMRLLQQNFKRLIKGEAAELLTSWRQQARVANVSEALEAATEASMSEVGELRQQLERSVSALVELSKTEELNRDETAQSKRGLEVQLDSALSAQGESSEALRLWEAAWAKEKEAIVEEFTRRDQVEVESALAGRQEKAALESSLAKYVKEEVQREASWGDQVADLKRANRELHGELQQAKADAAAEIFRLMARLDEVELPAVQGRVAKETLSFLQRWGSQYVEDHSEVNMRLHMNQLDQNQDGYVARTEWQPVADQYRER